MTDKAAANLVHQTSTGTGTGNLTLAVVNGKQSFNTAFGNGAPTDVFVYFISHQSAAEYERGTGHMSDATTLVRDTVIESTNSNNAVNFSAGTKDVTNDIPAASQVQLDLAQTLTNKTMVGGTTNTFSKLPVVFEPGGRLSLATATPIMTSTQSAKTTIFYVPYKHRYVPRYDGTSIYMVDIGGELSQTTTDTTKSPAAVIANTCYDIFSFNDGSERIARGPKWSKTSTITMTIASPCVVTWNGHGLPDGSTFTPTTTGALPTGLTAGNDYFITSTGPNTFKLSTTLANYVAGTFVNTSGTQSGTHTGENRTQARGTGAGTTELVQVQGVWMNANDITNGPAAQRGTYLGTVVSNGSSQIDWIYGALAANGTAAVLGVWNMYNRVNVATFVSDSTDSYAYSTSNTYRVANASSTMRISAVIGLNEEPVDSDYATAASATAASIGLFAAIGLDSIKAFAAGCITGTGTSVTSGDPLNIRAKFRGLLGLGLHHLWPLETPSGGTVNWLPDNGSPTINETGISATLRM
jgi:hypothetical protein